MQAVDGLDTPAAGAVARFADEVARALGGAILAMDGSDRAPEPAADGIERFRRAEGESGLTAWQRTLDAVQPGAVFVHGLGSAQPGMLLELGERGIPYAVFLHDDIVLCPTRRLWHRRNEICSGPGRTGWKCAWCVSGARGRRVELPWRMLSYRHRPQAWRTALLRADALVANSRYLREQFAAAGAPPERIAVIPPLAAAAGDHAATPVAARAPRLVFQGGEDEGEGAGLLAMALDQVRPPLHLSVMGCSGEEARTRWRSRLAPRHAIDFPDRDAAGSWSPEGDILVLPARWESVEARAVLEAQRAGVPVVATAVGAMPELILHGLNGYLATPDDAGSLAGAIAEAWAEPDRPAAARRRVTAAAWVARRTPPRLRQLLDLLLSRPPRSGAADGIEPALEIEHGAWLRATAAAEGLEGIELARALTAALREPDSTREVHAESVNTMIQMEGQACSLRRRLELNHGLAFLAGCGVRAVAARPTKLVPELEEELSAWGFNLVNDGQSAEAIWADMGSDDFDMHVLRQQYPNARAWVGVTPAGVETRELRDSAG